MPYGSRWGFGTANTPFGVAARRGGLEFCDPDQLAGLLDEMRAQELDSDDDGATNVEELSALTDPNSAEDIDLECEAPSRDNGGCAVAPGRSTSGRAAGWSALLALLGLSARLGRERREAAAADFRR